MKRHSIGTSSIVAGVDFGKGSDRSAVTLADREGRVIDSRDTTGMTAVDSQMVILDAALDNGAITPGVWYQQRNEMWRKREAGVFPCYTGGRRGAAKRRMVITVAMNASSRHLRRSRTAFRDELARINAQELGPARVEQEKRARRLALVEGDEEKWQQFLAEVPTVWMLCADMGIVLTTPQQLRARLEHEKEHPLDAESRETLVDREREKRGLPPRRYMTRSGRAAV